MGAADGAVGCWSGMLLFGLRGFLQWLAGGPVKVEAGLNWVGRVLWREFEVVVVSGGNVVTSICGGVGVMLGVLS